MLFADKRLHISPDCNFIITDFAELDVQKVGHLIDDKIFYLNL